MSKIDIIDYCGDCSQRFYVGNEMKCEKTDRVTHENNSIPSWCPLDDATEPTVEANAARQKGFKMDKDRTEICRIISEMLDNPDKCGIYPTSTAYTKLEHYVEEVRASAIGRKEMATKIKSLTIVCNQGVSQYFIGQKYNGLLLDHIEDKSLEFPDSISFIIYSGFTSTKECIFEAINAPVEVQYEPA